MDDPNRELAVSPDHGPERAPSTVGQRGVFLLFGVMIGAAVVLITLRTAQPTPSRVASSNPPAASQPVKTTPTDTSAVQPGPTTPNSGAAPGPDPKAGATTGGPQPASGTAPTPGGAAPGSTKPYNPFAGHAGTSMPPQEITGHIPPNPVGDQTSIQPTPDQPPKALLVTIRVNVGDPTQAVKAAEAVASKEGGNAIRYDDSALRAEPEGVILFVPAPKADQVEKELGSLGSVVVSEKWSGAAGERIDRIERDANDRLSALHVQRQELLIKFFEDAPPIKHIDEDSDRITKSLAALRAQKQGATIAVFKLKFL